MDDKNNQLTKIETLRKQIEEKLTFPQRLHLINMLNEHIIKDLETSRLDKTDQAVDLDVLQKEIEKLTPSQKLLLINMLDEQVGGMTESLEEMASALNLTQQLKTQS
jgi:hypothetical protein